jgi:hypothetical protein
MSNVVFILGAGASKQCGAPLMAEFLDVASSLHSTGKTGDASKDFETVFKAISALQAVHSKSQLDLNNIESIFNAFEVANTLGKLPGFEAGDIPGVIDSLKRVIVTTLEQTTMFPAKGSQISSPPPYGEFANLIKYLVDDAFPKKTVSVITFNYDMAIDFAFYYAGINADYSLGDAELKNGIPLLKLHGSLNWGSLAENGKVVPLPLHEYFAKYHLDSFDNEPTQIRILIGSQLKQSFSVAKGLKVNEEPVVVPPSWNKAEYQQTISQVWSRAAKEMTDAEYIFIIGYSLPETDAFFKLLYALGTVGDAPLKRIEIFNPDGSGQVESRFRSIMGSGALARFKYNPFQFSYGISLIRGYFPSRK